jgi:hypothetical protein
VANNITATFSEPVNGVSATTFTVRQGTAATGALVAAAVTQGTGNQWILDPAANLAPDTQYTVRLTGGPTAIRDLNGNSLTSVTWSFRTGPPPTVTARGPASSATSVAVANNITATFSEPVNGVTDTTLTVREGTTTTGALVAGAVSQSATNPNQWILDPTANLTPDTQYTVRLAGGTAAIRDLAGNPLASASWTFRTGPAPSITARGPASGATNVVRTNDITATFSEPVNGVSGTTFTLRNVATNTLEPAVVTQSTTNPNQWILDPTATLAASTQYRVTATGGTAAIRDLIGNPLSTTTWTFTTRAT